MCFDFQDNEAMVFFGNYQRESGSSGFEQVFIADVGSGGDSGTVQYVRDE